MASLDDAGKTAILCRMMLDTAAIGIPAIGFNVESSTEAWSSLCGTLEDNKTGDEIAYPGPDDKLRKVTVPAGIEEEQTCCVPIGICGGERESRDPIGQRGTE